MRLVIVRHGETEWSLAGRYTGTTDVGLTANGRQQAASLPSILDRVLHGQRAMLVSSPRQRATETAALALPAHRATSDPLVAEYDYGDYDGLTTEQIDQLAPGWNIWRDGCPYGESTADVGRRADAFLHAHAENDTQPVVAVTHGHFSRILAARALRLAPADGRLVRQRNGRGLADRRSPRRTVRRAVERRRSPARRRPRSSRSPGGHPPDPRWSQVLRLLLLYAFDRSWLRSAQHTLSFGCPPKDRDTRRRHGHPTQHAGHVLDHRIACRVHRDAVRAPGPLALRYMRCGKETCRCKAEPPQLHGPYQHWTRTIAGKTVTPTLTDEQAQRYQPWFDNARCFASSSPTSKPAPYEPFTTPRTDQRNGQDITPQMCGTSGMYAYTQAISAAVTAV